ncbi:MAG: protoporphyrinogen oxidase [Aquificota bacterium]|mgnify:CR=1 FL=1|nr:MAG: protoporphyrinogen oxidase [Aquificota bacterium]
MKEGVYQPGEDSYLLQGFVETLVEGRVLDMGTGSGIQGFTAAQKEEVDWVLAVDINPQALEAAKQWAHKHGVSDKMEFRVSDLFQNVEERFNWIVFNPPYLPAEGPASEASWAGGAAGTETIERFLGEAPNHLLPGGAILLVYSSLTGLKEDSLRGYKWEVLGKRDLFFETLFCVRLSPS